MTDNNNHLDEFEQHDLGQEHEPDQRSGTGLRANLTHAWRTQPLVKLLALMVIVAAIVGVTLSLFSSSDKEHKNSASMSTPPILHEAPGGQATEMVREQTVLANQQRENDALKNGKSAIPTPLGSDQDLKSTDPLNELRTQIESLQKEVNRPKPAQPQVTQQQMQQAQAPEQFDEGLAHAMQKQMSDLATSWGPRKIASVTIPKVTLGTSAPATARFGGANSSAADAALSTAPKILIPAGTINYAKLLTQANSDVPGPILAEIVSGPLTGARVIGSFQVENAYAEYLVLRFNLAELKGKEYQINTLAIDPDTSLGGMATDVDERYFERLFLPAAAAFLQGVGSALSTPSSDTSENGNTTIVSQAGPSLDQGMFRGASQAAQTAGQFFQNQANNTKPLIVVAAGTPMGLMFVSSLKDQPSSLATNGKGAGALINSGLAGYSDSTASTSSYPGTTVAGYGGGNSSANNPYPAGLNMSSSNGMYGNGMGGMGGGYNPAMSLLAPH